MTASNRKERQAGLPLESAAFLRDHQQECRSRRWPPQLSLRRWNAAVAATLITTSPVALPAFAAVLLVGLLPTSASAQLLPSPRLSVEPTASGELTARWDPVDNADSYELRYRISGSTTSWNPDENVKRITQATSPQKITDLTNDQTYQVRVYSLRRLSNNVTSRAGSNIVEATPVLPPTSISNLQLTPKNSSLEVSWTAATVAPNGYSVRWRQIDPKPSERNLSPVNEVDGTSFTIPDLTNGFLYLVVVHTRNLANDGIEGSTRVSLSDRPVNMRPTVANPIPNQRATVGTPFSYTFPADTFSDDGTTLTYTAYRRISLSRATLPSWLTFNASTRTFSGTPGTTDVDVDTDVDTVFVNVIASDTGGESVNDEFNIVVAENAPPMIMPIDNQTATLGTDLEVDVAATDAEDDMLQYKAESSATAVATVTPATLMDLGANSKIRVTPVAAGTAEITVTVIDGTPGPTTNTFMVTVSRAPLGTPEVTLEAGDGQLTPSWEAVTGASSYELQWKRSSVTSWAATTGVTTVASTTSGTAITGLTNDEAHDVRVRAKAGAASRTYVDSEWSGGTQGTPTAANVAPMIMDITDKSVVFDRDLMVDVDATDSDAGDTLQYSASSSATAVATVSPTTLTNLDANSQVTVTPVGEGTATITVTVSDGTAMPTDTFMVTVSRAPLGTPEVTLEAGDGQLTPSWEAVTGASSYELQWKRSSVTSWAATTGVTTVASTTSGTAITGLTNDEAHDVRVRAKAGAASRTYVDSEWSGGTQGTPTAANVAPMIMDITDKSVVFDRDLMVDVDATDSDAGDTLQYSASSSATAVATVSPTTLTNLDANSQVTVTPVGEGTATITVTVSDGTAMPTDTFMVTVSRAPLGTPEVTLEAGDGQLTPSWEAVTGASSYELQWKRSSVTSWAATTGVTTVASTTSGTAITGLTNDEAHDVRVRAKAGAASRTYVDSEWSGGTQGTPTAANVAPMIMDITDKSVVFDRDLMVDVDATDSDAGDTLQYSASSSATAVATVSPTTLTNLDANSQVTVTPVGEGTATITVTVSDGTAMPTDTFMVTVSRAPLGTPEVTLEAGDGQLTPSWEAVTGASSYELQWKRSSVTSWAATTGVTTVASTTSGTAITGLTNDEAHDVRVRAKAGAASRTYVDSEWSGGTQGTPTASGNMVTKEKLDEVNEEVAPSIINEVAARQTAIITNRFEIISSGLNRGDLSMEKMATDVADYLFSHHQEIQANGLDWRQALSGNNFSFALADTNVSQGSIGDQELSSFGPASFWAGIDYSSLEDKIKGFILDGDITSFNLGVDKEFTSDLVLGILLSIANSEFELTEGSTDSTYEVDIFTLNPYISWQESEDSSLWASVGYGRGQVDLTGDSTNPPVSERGNFTRFSAGGRFQLWQSEAGTGLALKLDGTTAHFLGADVQRSRLATELSHDFSIESGVLNTALELGLLMSSADESAAELVGRLHWQGDAGLSSSIRSRVLLGGGDRQEWGIGGALRYTAGGGEGLMMSLEPSFGISNPQLLPDLWQVTTSNPASTTAAPTAQLNAKLAYGFPTTGGLLTPYTDFSFSDTTSTYGAGLRYGLSTGLDLDLKGTHKTTTMDDAENSILLELRSDL